jgi:hypothetical protein
MKSRRGRGGHEDIRISNIVMEDVICPLHNLYYFCGRAAAKYVWDKTIHHR